MKVPAEIQRLAIQGLEQMYANPKHRFDWRIRRRLYQQFQKEDQAAGYQAHGWLAVIAAEHVLPTFTSTFPHDLLPVRLVRYAKRILTGSIARTSLCWLLASSKRVLGTFHEFIDIRLDYVVEKRVALPRPFEATADFSGG